MAFTVTATEGGSTTNGISLLVRVLTGQAASPVGITASATNSTPSLSTGTGVSTGSWVYGAIIGLTTITANGSTTFGNNHNGGGLQYIGMRTTSAMTGGSAVTVGGTGGTGISICLLEILAAAGALAEDASSPAGVFASAAITVATASFAPPNGSLLVAAASSNGAGSVTTMAITDTSGLSLTWTEQVKQNVAGSGYSGLWTAPMPAAAAAATPAPLIVPSLAAIQAATW
jgi:hypothetical protein